jgi:integrase
MGMYKCSFEKFPAIKESPARLISPKAEDVERLLMKMPQDLRDMAGFHVLTGCRPQELVGLKKEDLHRENGQAFFVVKPKSEKLMRQPKPRIIALSRSPLDIVIRAVNQHPDSHTIFVNEDGKPYTTSTYRQRLQRWCKRAGIRRLPPYALRHFFGTHQAGIGTNNQVLSQIMGHTTTRTLSRYVEPVPEYQQKAMEDHEQNMRRLLKNSFDECKVETESTADSTAKPVGGTQEASEDAATPCKKAS